MKKDKKIKLKGKVEDKIGEYMMKDIIGDQ